MILNEMWFLEICDRRCDGRAAPYRDARTHLNKAVFTTASGAGAVMYKPLAKRQKSKCGTDRRTDGLNEGWTDGRSDL